MEFERWISYYKNILEEKRDLTELNSIFTSEYNKYLNNKQKLINLINEQNDYEEEVINKIIDSALNYKNTIKTQELEHIPITEDQLKKSIVSDEITYAQLLNARMLYFHYKEVEYDLPFSIDDIKLAHRNTNRYERTMKPGQIRNPRTNKVNVKINLTNKVFVEYQFVARELKRLIDYMNDNNESPIVSSAMIHGYLVGIHPFVDGNGRISRFFSDKYLELKLKDKLYLSEAILNHRHEYYSCLDEFHFNLNPIPFINFIFRCSLEQMSLNIGTIIDIASTLDNFIKKISLSKTIMVKYHKILSYLLVSHGYITNKMIVEACGVTKATATTLLNKLTKEGIIDSPIKEGRTSIYKLINV